MEMQDAIDRANGAALRRLDAHTRFIIERPEPGRFRVWFWQIDGGGNGYGEGATLLEAMAALGDDHA